MSNRPYREGHCHFSCLAVFYDSCRFIFISLGYDAQGTGVKYLSPVSKHENVLNEGNAKLGCASSLLRRP